VRKVHLLAIAGAAMSISLSCHAATLIPVIAPSGAVTTRLLGINDSNIIAGSYFDSSNVEHGFFGTLDGNYTTFDFGGSSTGTEIRGIGDDGSVDGFAATPGFVFGQEFFRAPDGTVSTFTHKGTTLDGVVQGITKSEISFGDYFNGNGKRTGFEGRKGHFKAKFDFPLANLQNSPRGTNRAGVVAGYFIDSGGGEHGFTLQNGVANVIDYPNADAQLTVLEGINNGGVATGQWNDSNGNPHAFVLDTTTGTFTDLTADDGSSFQQAWGINNHGLVAFSTSAASYIYCPRSPSHCPGTGTAISLHTTHVVPGAFLKYARKSPPEGHLAKGAAAQ